MQLLLSLFNVTYNDVAEPWQLGYQDSASPVFTGIETLHNTIGFYLIIILVSVVWVGSSIVYYFNKNRNPFPYKYATHGSTIELIWTIAPALFLIIFAFPSFRLLYIMDEVISPTLTIKATGNQWYWSYELSDFSTGEDGVNIQFDSYMIPESDLESGQFRLLDVDNPLVIPADCHIRLIVTGSDVIHSFAVPSLGLKLDCVPGRLNQTSMLAERIGTFYGQCSEICGVWHGWKT